MIDLGEVDARRSVTASEQERDRVFAKTRELVRQLTAELDDVNIHTYTDTQGERNE